MDAKEVYAITNVRDYAIDMRELAAKSLCEDTTENLNEYISIDQVIDLIDDNCLGYDDDNQYLVNEEVNEQIFENVRVWIHNVGVCKLAGQDFIECAWDDKLNEMVFWDKNHEQSNQSEKSDS